MSISRKTIVAGLISCALTAPSMADENEGTFFGQDATGKWMLGVKGGVLQSGTDGFGDATNAGILLGYRFSRAIGGIGGSSSIEFEGTTTVDDGDFSNGAGTWDADTYALFFTYATPGTVYFKGKLGGMAADVSSSVPNVGEDDTGFAYGAGLGVKAGQSGRFEIEYSGSSGNNNLSFLTVGGILEF